MRKLARGINEGLLDSCTKENESRVSASMKVLGLFSGIGGFELGLQKAGFSIAALCEFEPYCRKVLEKNFPETRLFTDIRALHITEGEYDLLCGGFPCQDISIGGKNKGLEKGEKSSLWFEYKRLIAEGKPKYAIIENVSALRSRGLETILQDLAEIGYDATWTMLDSKYCGSPQRRRRVYIVAVRDGIPTDADLFQFKRRDSTNHRGKVAAIDQERRWSFEAGENGGYAFTYFTRQRSNLFIENGLASTIVKRDYKSYTDIVKYSGGLRRVTPEERLLFQGFPVDWWRDCGLSNTQKFKCNGMTVKTVQHIGNCINEYERNI